MLISTELILTYTCWYNAKNLNYARWGNTSLSEPRVRNLIATRCGSNQSLINLNLAGTDLSKADLSYANLKGANLIGAKLQGVCLEGANLKLVKALGADFTAAQMTGACIEAWAIDSTTRLEQVDCRYIYRLEFPQPGDK